MLCRREIKQFPFQELTQDSTSYDSLQSSPSTAATQLLNLVSNLVEPGPIKKCLTITLHLPYGISSDHFSIRVSEDEPAILFKVIRSKPSVDLMHLHQK